MKKGEFRALVWGMCFSFLFAFAPIMLDFAYGAPEAIKVGASVSLTGKFAAGGVDVADGYKLAAKHINENGGVFVKEYGKKIPLEIIIYDDESDPNKTVTRLEKLHSVDKVVAYLGGFSSAMNTAGLAIGEKNKVPWVGVTIAAESVFSQGFKYTFAPCMFSFMEVTAFFDALDSTPPNKRPKKIANFELQSDWGIECGKYLKKFGAERGYEIALVQKYAKGTSDFAPLIMAAKAAGCDAVFSVPTPPQSMTLIKQMKELDYAPKATCLIRGPDLSNYWKIMGEDANYILTCGEWSPEMKYPGNKKLVDAYRAEKPGKIIGMQVGCAYGAVQILADAIERAGILKGTAIRDALKKTDLMTVRGHVTFDDRGIGQVPYSLCQWQNGKLEVVVNPDFTTASFLPAPAWSER
jgi:branched-chain amino acid transport system substrate-binding protein